MRRFSRWMPTASAIRTEAASPGGLLLLAAIVGGVLAGIVFSSSFRIILASVIALGVVFHLLEMRRLRRLAAERAGEGLCTFARSFSRPGLDPWVVRATYEELTPWVAVGETWVPLRASDRLDKDLRIDWEDVEDIVKDIALRSGRSLQNPERNPLYGRVRTVGELVQFIVLQPPSGAA